MGAVPAQVAGVERVAVVTPPGPDGRAGAVILAAASLLGIDEVYAVGGASGDRRAGLTAPTTIAPRRRDRRPGQRLGARGQAPGRSAPSGSTASPAPARCSSSPTATPMPRAIAADLLAQAEHGPDSPAILVSADAAFTRRGRARARRRAGDAGAITLVRLPRASTSPSSSPRRSRPSTWSCASRDAADARRASSPRGRGLRRPNGATAFGDYVAGSNHVLPDGRGGPVRLGARPGDVHAAHVGGRVDRGCGRRAHTASGSVGRTRRGSRCTAARPRSGRSNRAGSDA